MSLFRSLVAACCVASAAPAASLDREIVLTPHTGAQREDAEIVRWQERAQAPQATAATFERLGWAYVAKARRSQDAGFYKLAEKTADVLDAQFGASADSRLLRGHVLHNLHQFRAAEAIARRLVAERGSPADLALLSDALVERGAIDDAIPLLEKLVNVKPGTEAFSRIAHVRWLKGDLPGACAAIEMALQAASAAEVEIQAWLLVRLAGFRLQGGDRVSALTTADSAISMAPDYAPALLARGRVLLALERTGEAVKALQAAAQLNPLPEYHWWLADALRAAGREPEAVKVEAILKARGALDDPRTYALYLATRGPDAAEAVRLARAELEHRADVFTHDALAWALLANGELDAASDAMRAALAERTRDARLFLHAGEIARRRGGDHEAARYFAEARNAAATLTPPERALLDRRLAGEAIAGAN